ncbi:MAG: hypothetical protein JW953_17640 [Anaerolineae bacterium]|nr:hypothetical protein [Anaerolineae bacterium]
MTEDTYNGWHNRETWLVNLWIDNEPYLYERANECRSASEIEEMIDEVFENEEFSSELFNDLINAALCRVDWHEIYKARKEEEELQQQTAELSPSQK